MKYAALIVATQNVEHCEIAGYGSVRTFAQFLGKEEILELLDETFDEGKAANEKLTECATAIKVEAGVGDTSDEE